MAARRYRHFALPKSPNNFTIFSARRISLPVTAVNTTEEANSTYRNGRHYLILLELRPSHDYDPAAITKSVSQLSRKSDENSRFHLAYLFKDKQTNKQTSIYKNKQTNI